MSQASLTERGPGRVYQHAVMGGELGIRAVDLRVIQIGPVHSGTQVIRDQPGRRTPEERERLDMAGSPRRLVHRQHRAQEQVPAAGQHHHEAPHPPPAAAHRVNPRTQIAVIDLPLVAGWRVVAEHPHPRAHRLLRQVRRDPPLQRRHRRLEPALIVQPLPDRLLRHSQLQLRDDVVTVRLDLRPGDLPQPRVGQLREPVPHQHRPLRLRPRRPARRHPGLQRRGQVLLHRLAIHTQAGRDLTLRPARIPVDQDLRHVNHVESSPRHPGSHRSDPTEAAFEMRGPHQRRHARHPGAELRERRPAELRERQTPQPGELRERRQIA